MNKLKIFLFLFFIISISYAQVPSQLNQAPANPNNQNQQQTNPGEAQTGNTRGVTSAPTPVSTLKAINYEKIKVRYHYAREGEISTAQHLLDIIKMLKTKITTFKGMDFNKEFTTKFIAQKKFELGEVIYDCFVDTEPTGLETRRIDKLEEAKHKVEELIESNAK